ncbi:MAG: MotA/TolQ/ExbB proton channel family protein [Acidobacteria bacterium]|nr:MotA/TolQ/ExbB proton channel family protein [Acidobacteriota bacterium]
MISHPVVALLLQMDMWEMVSRAKPIPMAVLAFLLVFSLLSWAIIFGKWNALRQARLANLQFIRAFRKAPTLDAVAVAAEQFRVSPLVAVFDFGFEEIERQMKNYRKLRNPLALERALQLGISEELAKLERNLNWLATVASVSPFVGLLGTVVGIIDSFQALGLAGSASLRAVAPGISEALIATAAGLGAAIPAAIFYNYFGHVIREMGARMEDFSLEFLNVAERNIEA